MKNEYIQGASGEVPPHETLPEIWLLDNTQEEQALKLVNELEDDLRTGDADWTCQSCNETNESPFMICWNCQATK